MTKNKILTKSFTVIFVSYSRNNLRSLYKIQVLSYILFNLKKLGSVLQVIF